MTVSGTVSEFRPGGAGGDQPDHHRDRQPAGDGRRHRPALPAPTIVGPGGRVPPTAVIDDDATGDVETWRFDPTTDGLDFWESMEGMLAGIDHAGVAGRPARSARSRRPGRLEHAHRPRRRPTAATATSTPSGSSSTTTLAPVPRREDRGEVRRCRSACSTTASATSSSPAHDADRRRRRRPARDDQRSGAARAGDGDVQRGEPRPDRLRRTSSTGWRQTVVHNLQSPDIVAGGDPGQRRCGRTTASSRRT